MAHNQLPPLRLLFGWSAKLWLGVCDGFSGNWEVLLEVTGMGYYVSFGNP